MSRLVKIAEDLESRRAFDLSPPPAVDTGSVLAVVGGEVRHIAQDGAPDGYVLTVNSGAPGNLAWEPGGGGGGGGGGAPTNATYVTLSLNGTLTNERVLQTTGTGLGLLDNGAGSTVDLFLDSDLEALAGVSTTGLLVRTGAGTATTRTITVDAGSTAYLTVANGSGVAGNPTFSVDPYAIGDLIVDDRFGDGSDGAVTLGSDTTITRDMQYTNLNLAGFALTANGYRVRVAGTLSDSVGTGRISNNGGAASGTTGGQAAPAGTLGGGQPGVTAAAAGANGSNNTNSANNVWSTRYGATNGRGGTGGASGAGQTGGTGGTVAAPSQLVGWGGSFFWDTGYFPSPASGAVRPQGGSGGGGGGAGAGVGARGGTPGGSGGICMVWAFRVNCPSTTKITANGGNGNSGTLGAAAGVGGGGGGGGGTAALIYAYATSMPTLEANGGLGGSGQGAGSAGANGNAGNTETHRVRV